MDPELVLGKEGNIILCDQEVLCSNCKKLLKAGDTAYYCHSHNNIKGYPLILCTRFYSQVNNHKFNCKTDFSKCKALPEHTHYKGIIEIKKGEQ
jgi:hypothetical protein